MSAEGHGAPEALLNWARGAETGARRPAGLAAAVICALSLAWALFQLWYASPLPFTLGFGILNDTQARSLHLALALFLAFAVWPARRAAPRDRVPALDWVLALSAACAAAYLLLFDAALATRPGQPTDLDLAVAGTGLLLLLEATRRALGWPMAALALLFIAYALFGPLMPDVLSHKGASLPRLLTHLWLTTEGVFGIPLGVSTGTIFLYVLFGTLLDRAGGGNYMMQVSVAALGHLRGGPAKVAVVSSALNGLISGSSVSNVVSGGIFTIPLMKKAGYGGIKAGAIETMSSVNGQLMPPVMGAAAFLMVEYVGIPYPEIVRHAILPAALSYIGLFYIVHLEALKLGLRPAIQRQARTWGEAVRRVALGLSGSLTLVGVLYYLLSAIQTGLGASAPWAVGAFVLGLYGIAAWQAARSPDLPEDIQVEGPRALATWPTVRAGLHFLIPVGTLVWCLMVEELSPALSAFWAAAVLMAIMLTQRPLICILRGGDTSATWVQGARELVLGLLDGSRNMIGIAAATATAGIIVGCITLTGLGLRMTELIELVSQGHLMLMLLVTALACLVLGLGVPTTANYVLVATLMAPVMVELGAQAGLAIPLIAVHLFVFYFGIMGDITPPVGLATFAAAAISGEDALRTGVQGLLYALRTAILPFVWIFNPQLLLVDVHSGVELAVVVLGSTVAMLLFAALTLGWWRTRLHWGEGAVLAVAVGLLFRPDFFMDALVPALRDAPPAELFAIAGAAPAGGRLALVIAGTTLEGKDLVKTLTLRLGDRVLSGTAGAADGRERLAEAGLTLVPLGGRLEIAQVRFGSRADKGGFEQGWELRAVQVPTGRASAHWLYLPALALAGLVWWRQGRRLPT